MDNKTGALTSFVRLYKGRGVNMANAVPIRPVEVFSPMARAISFPLNQRTTALFAAIPNISHPTPKTAKPNPAITADLAVSPRTCHEPILSAYVPVTCPEIAQYLIPAPISMIPIAKTPVKRVPSLSSIMPLKTNISKNTLNQP